MTGAVLKFTVLRLSLFVVTTVVVWQLGAPPLLAALAGAVLSLLLSYVLLRGPREEVARQVAERVAARGEARADRAPRRPRGGRARDEAAEDSAADALRLAEERRREPGPQERP